MKHIKDLLKRDRWLILLIVIFSLWQVRFLFLPWFFTFSDELHIGNIYEMVRAFQGGQIPPRWAPDMAYNFGSPLFIFFYPLPFYLGAFLNIVLKMSLVASLKWAFGLTLPLSGIFFYKLMKKFFKNPFAFAGAIIYMYTPYRAVDLYVRGAVGELWGFVFMPLVLYCFVSLIEKFSYRNLAFAGLSLAGLMLSHTLTPFLFLPTVVIFLAAHIYIRKNRRESVKNTISGLLLGLGISSYNWLPTILENKYIQPGSPYFPLDHFPFIKQLIIPFWGYGASNWGPYDDMSFQIGVVNLILILSGILLLIFLRRKLEKEKIILLGTSLLIIISAIFLMNVRSWFIWQIIPLGDYVQFPWRFLILVTFYSSLLVGFLEYVSFRKLTNVFAPVLATLAIILTFNYFAPGKEVYYDDDYYLKTFFLNRAASGRNQTISKDYFNYTENWIPIPIGRSVRPIGVFPIFDSSPSAVLDIKEITPTNYRVTAEFAKPGILIFNTYYFPGWQAELDGKSAKIETLKPYGNMGINISFGYHKASFIFKETPLRKIADWISFFGLVFAGYLILHRKRHANT